MLECYKSMDNSAIHSIRNSNSSFSASPQHPITPCSYTLSSFLELTNHNHSMNFTPPQAVSAYLNIYIYNPSRASLVAQYKESTC